jgi:calreticulin
LFRKKALKIKMKFVFLFATIACVSAKVYFKEQFSSMDKWTHASKSDLGKFVLASGKYSGESGDQGLKTSEDAKFYGIFASLDEAIKTDDKPLVIQYSVKHEQGIDCGGGYLKLHPAGAVDADSHHAEKDPSREKYGVMFGPDVCGNTKRTHVIFGYNDEHLLVKKEPRMEHDELSHTYTLVVKPDNTYSVKIDNSEVQSGSMYDDFDFLKPKEINDPSKSKPDDWVDEKKIPDPEAKKPEGYDDIPEKIPEPDAEKPEDWDEEEDGEWEPPMIDNPEFKGPWSAPMIDNPDYKGEWEHPQIANPDFVDDKEVYKSLCSGKGCGQISFDLWQVKSGTIFDDIIITDDEAEAKAFYDETHAVKAPKEKELKEAADKKAEEEKKAKEEADKKEEEKDDDDDEDWEEEEKEDL